MHPLPHEVALPTALALHKAFQLRAFRNQNHVGILLGPTDLLGVVQFTLSGFSVFVYVNRLDVDLSSVRHLECQIGKVNSP